MDSGLAGFGPRPGMTGNLRGIGDVAQVMRKAGAMAARRLAGQ